jgi:hypothetical protein
MHFNNNGFGAGFGQGWGLADSYLNRQNERKRQEVLDARYNEEQRYARERDDVKDARNKELDAFDKEQYYDGLDTAAHTRLEEQDRYDAKELRDIDTHGWATTEAKRAEEKEVRDEKARKLVETNKQRAEVFHKWRALPNPEDPNDPRVIKYMRELNILSELDIKDPGIAMAYYNRLNKAIESGQFTSQDVVAANAVYGEAINQRPSNIDADKTVMGVQYDEAGNATGNGKQFTVPKGSKINQRDIIGVTPIPDGKGFVMKMRIMATLPDGITQVEYIADATQQGATDASAGPQVQQPKDFLAMNQLKQGIIQQIAQSSATLQKSEGANYANSEIGKGQMALNKNASEIAKNTAATAETKRKADAAALKSEWDQVKNELAGSDQFKGKDKDQQRAAFFSSFSALGPAMQQKWGVRNFSDLSSHAKSKVMAAFKRTWEVAVANGYSMSDDQYLKDLEKEIMLSIPAANETPKQAKARKAKLVQSRVAEDLAKAKSKPEARGLADARNKKLKVRQGVDPKWMDHIRNKGSLTGVNDT